MTSADASGPGPAPRLLLPLLAFGNFLVGMGAFVVIGILGPIATGLHVSPSEAGLTLTVYSIVYAVGSPLLVAVLGRMDRRLLILLGLGLFLAGTVASALAPSLQALLVARIPVALGAGIFTPTAAGIAVAVSAPEERGRALALVFGGLPLAQAIGVPVAAWIGYRFGWQETFWAVSVVTALGLALIGFATPARLPFQVTNLASFLTVFRDRVTSFAIVFTAIFLAAIYVFYTYFGAAIEVSLGPNPELHAFYFVIFGIGAVIGNAVGGYLTDRIGSVRTLTLLCIAQAVLLLGFSFVPLPALVLALLVMMWSVCGWSFVVPQQARLVVLAPHAQNLVLALNAACIYVGIALGSGLGSVVLRHFGLSALGVAASAVALLALAHVRLSHAQARRARATPTEA